MVRKEESQMRKFNNKPLLLSYAVDRNHNGSKKIFHYVYDRDINVLNDASEVPFIEAGHRASCVKASNAFTGDVSVRNAVQKHNADARSVFSELYTKTHASEERDDEEEYFAELETKTEQQREADDEEPDWLSLQYYQELISKTFADRERDDEEDDVLLDKYQAETL